MESAEKYQRQLLEQAKAIYYETPLSEATQQAYLATPRHRFVKRYRQWRVKEWNEVNENNLEGHLATLYADRALVLFGEDDDDVPSTISQPSFVLRMLDMLQLGQGQRVFELGTGSGWNAALMGNLVEPDGDVYSLELIPEMARTAAATLDALGIKNVHVIEADGGEGYPDAAPYDRAIFTAGAYDLPHPFFEQIKEGGLLLIVIKSEGGGDTLFLLRKEDDHFESLEGMPCGFVQMRGKYQLDRLKPIQLEELPEWSELQQKLIRTRPFWWGGKGKGDFRWRTMGVRSFLGITEPSFRAFRTEKQKEQVREDHYFGLWDRDQGSLVIAKDDLLLSYGNSAAEERLTRGLEQWVKLGMPGAASFGLKIYPIEFPLTTNENEWIVKRSESQFLWSLKNLAF
jgi:protein-L-isoaspartate(D-aspartate) O-methyltransferase